MRILKLAAAIGLMIGTLGLAPTADAQPYPGRGPGAASRADYNRDVLGIPGGRRDGDRRYNRAERRGDRSYRRNDRRYDRGYRRDWRRDGYRNARNCRTVWRHHRRVRVCR